MPYVERITRAGKTIEVERYFTSRYKKPGIKRGDKVKPTKEQQAKVNTRQAERKLRILMNANFGYGDYHLELDYMHHVPNGGKRDRATAVALKRQGVKAGVPDIVLPAARAGYHGLYIELKAGKNTTTENQRRWLEYLRQQGYYTAVCYGWQKAAELIERYLLHTEELTKEQKTITLR